MKVASIMIGSVIISITLAIAGITLVNPEFWVILTTYSIISLIKLGD